MERELRLGGAEKHPCRALGWAPRTAACESSRNNSQWALGATETWGGLCFRHRHGNCPLSATQSRPQPLKCVVFVLYRCSGEPGCEASVGTRGERSVDSLRGGLPPSSMSPWGGTLGSLWTSAASTTQWSPGRHPQAVKIRTETSSDTVMGMMSMVAFVHPKPANSGAGSSSSHVPTGLNQVSQL